MLNKLNDFIIDCSLDIKKSLVLIAGFSLTLWQLLSVSARFPAISGGHEPFDMQNDLTQEQVFEQLSTWTDEAVSQYLYFQFVDFFFPLLGGLMMATLCAFAVRTLSDKYYLIAVDKKLFLLFLVPTVFDWLENTGFLLVVSTLPEASEGAAGFGVLAKQFKLGSLMITQPVALILLTSGCLKWLWVKLRG